MPDGADRPASESRRPAGSGAAAPARAPEGEQTLRLKNPLPGSGRPRGPQPPAAERPEQAPPRGSGRGATPPERPAAPLPLGAPPAVPHRRHRAAAAGFVLMVVLPTVLSALYLVFVAADRYGSKTAFSVRSNEVTAPLEILGTVTQLGNSSAVLDGQILYDFIRSQQIVEQVNASLPLEDYWNRAPDDRVFSLGRGQPIEEITEHWNDAVDVSLDPASGILTVEARAFRPEEAQAIAQAVLDASAQLVNQLADTARRDAVTNAKYDLAEAETRLRDIRGRLRVFRDLEQEVDPSLNARVAIELVARLEEELSEAQTQRDLLAAALSADSPRIQFLRHRIETLEDRIATERTRLGTGRAEGPDGARPLAEVVGDFEELVVDREFAEKAYTLALSTYEQAQAEARRRHRYLAAHVRPTLSERAEYPDRPLLVAAIFGLSLALWSVLLLIGWNIRDRR